MRQLFYSILAAMFALGLTACDKHAHDSESSGVSLFLQWDEETDKGTDVSGISLWIYRNGENTPVYVGYYESAAALASGNIPLEKGSYTLLTMLNLTEPYMTNAPATRTASTPGEITISLDNVFHADRHAWYSTQRLEVTDERKLTVPVPLRRVLSEMSVAVTGAPANSSLDVEVSNSATALLPLATDSEGRYGVTTMEEAIVVKFPTATEEQGTIMPDTMKVMATPPEALHTLMRLLIKDGNGNIQDIHIDAPPMRPGGKYAITLPYEELRPYMTLEAVRINDWEEVWSLNGEVLNPDTN